MKEKVAKIFWRAPAPQPPLRRCARPQNRYVSLGWNGRPGNKRTEQYNQRQEQDMKNMGAGKAPREISATFTFIYWSKTSIFGSNRHSTHHNSSHLKCSSITMSAWNLTKLQDLMSDTLRDTFQP